MTSRNTFLKSIHSRISLVTKSTPLNFFILVLSFLRLKSQFPRNLIWTGMDRRRWGALARLLWLCQLFGLSLSSPRLKRHDGAEARRVVTRVELARKLAYKKRKTQFTTWLLRENLDYLRKSERFLLVWQLKGSLQHPYEELRMPRKAWPLWGHQGPNRKADDGNQHRPSD